MHEDGGKVLGEYGVGESGHEAGRGSVRRGRYKGGVDALSRAGSKETSGEAQGGADARARWESARRIRGQGKADMRQAVGSVRRLRGGREKQFRHTRDGGIPSERVLCGGRRDG